MGYLILTCPPGEPSRLFHCLVEDARARRGWRQVVTAYNLAAFTFGGLRPTIMPLVGRRGVGGVVVGEIYDRAATEDGAARVANLDGLIDQDPIDACRNLVAGAWGAYVALLVPNRRVPPVVLRDPLGGIEALTWRLDAVTLLASDLPDGAFQPRDLAIDHTRLADILAETPRAAAVLPLSGVEAVLPGTCRHGPGGREVLTLWTPGEVVRRSKAIPSPEAVRRVVEACAAALAQGRKRILCEISGGLDSAIVAGALAQVGRRPDAAINFYRNRAESDERVYAQAAADLVGAPLQVVCRDPFVLTQAKLANGATTARPGFNGIDPDYDRLLAQALKAAKADVLFTGHGGDVVFYQLAAAQIAADLLTGVACEGSRLARLGEIARRTRRSVWSLAWEALRRRPGQGSPALTRPANGFICPAHGAPHPWLTDLFGVAPAKRAQIAGLVNNQSVFAPSQRGATARLAHPLLTQPVVELCLAIPAPILSAGEGDRGFARAAFADLLPLSILHRRSKGDVTVFFGRSVAASLPFLRPFLLEGRLAALGLIDRARLEAAMTPESLVWRDDYGAILTAAQVEAWLRHWEGRISAGAVAGAAPPAATSDAALGSDGAPIAARRKAKARP